MKNRGKDQAGFHTIGYCRGDRRIALAALAAGPGAHSTRGSGARSLALGRRRTGAETVALRGTLTSSWSWGSGSIPPRTGGLALRERKGGRLPENRRGSGRIVRPHGTADEQSGLILS